MIYMGLEETIGNFETEEIPYNEAYCDTAQTQTDILRKHFSDTELRELLYFSPHINKRIQAGLTLIYSDSCSNEELVRLYNHPLSELRIAAGTQLGYSKSKIKINEALYPISSWFERKYHSSLRIKF